MTPPLDRSVSSRATRTAWQRAGDIFWPVLALVAVCASVWLLYHKLKAEVASDPAVRTVLETGGLWSHLLVIARAIGERLSQIPLEGYLLAGASTLVAYAALAWYDRIALIHLKRDKGISWWFIGVCSFVTYALGHNIGASVVSGGMVRMRAYTAKGLTPGQVAVLVALCSFTFVFGTVVLMGAVLLFKPEVLAPLHELVPIMAMPEGAVRALGGGLLALCGLYVLGSWMHFKPMHIGTLEIVYPRLPVVFRQLVAAPLELIGAAGIIYFALPEVGHPGFVIVLGAFLISFSAGLLSQVPGGVGVMEAVFIAVMPGIPATAVLAALLVWRLLYLLIPLALSVPAILAFERGQLLSRR
jgi:glycosyltransferase 2 family protein